MKGKKTKEKPNAQINADVSSTPKNIYTNYAQLNEKDKAVHRFAERCRLLLLEIQERSETLQNYAADLVVMDKELREAQNSFDEELEATTLEFSEQEEEYLHKLATLKQQKEQIKNAQDSFSHTISSYVSKNFQNIEEKKTLTEKKANISNDLLKPVQQISIEKIDFEIDQKKKKILNLDNEISSKKGTIEQIKDHSSSLLSSLNNEIQKLNKQKAVVKSAKDENEEKINVLKSNINTSNKDCQELSAQEITLLGEQSLISKRINEKKERTQKAEEAQLDIANKLKPYQKKLKAFQNNLQKIKEEEKQFVEALQKRAEFDRGIKTSIQRAQLRSKEIETQIDTIRAQKKKVDINHFLEEEKIEKLTDEEKEILIQLGDLSSESTEFQKEEEEVDLQAATISESYDAYKEETMNYQKMLLKTQNILKKLKEQIIDSKKEQKTLVKHIKELQNSNYIPSGPEIEKEKNQINVLLKGYRTQISYTRDHCQNLTKSIKTEELKSAISNSEMRRINNGIKNSSSIINTSDCFSISVSEKDKDSKISKVKSLKIAIAELEIRKSEIQKKVTNSQLEISKKNQTIEESQKKYNTYKSDKFSKDNKLNEIKDNIKSREAMANLLCKSVVIMLNSINQSKDNWTTIGDEDDNDVSVLKQWNTIISNLNDNAEDLEAQFHKIV